MSTNHWREWGVYGRMSTEKCIWNEVGGDTFAMLMNFLCFFFCSSLFLVDSVAGSTFSVVANAI